MVDVNKKLNVLMVGTGEYTTGWTSSGTASTSDKKIGVVALVMFDLRRRGKVDQLSLVGTIGTKFPAIREHLQKNIANVYRDMEVQVQTFPADNEVDPHAYKTAIDALSPGDAITIFTPDSTHYDIALYAVQRGIHVLVTKPAVKLLTHHQILVDEAQQHNVVIMVEHHKRWDPVYSDAVARMRRMGDFGYFYSYMSQPKKQLLTFKNWAGKDSDISYYLNSHHIDIHCWAMEGLAEPVSVTAMAATGTAISAPYKCFPNTEDTITLMAQWRSIKTGHLGTAIYTASWAAPLGSDVHSQQYFHYMSAGGEVRVDQAHRGYTVTTDADGQNSLNPLYMKYTADDNGYYSGQHGYGYQSLEAFVDRCREVNAGRKKAIDLDKNVGNPTIGNTLITTAILEAGRISLDNGGKTVGIVRDGRGNWALSL